MNKKERLRLLNLVEIVQDCRVVVNDIRKGEEAKFKKFKLGTRTSPIALQILDDEEYLTDIIMDLDDIINRLKRAL